MRTYPALDQDLRCDALVVGGGITGALIAHSLVAAGVDCIVVDRRDIAHGSTSASTGLLQYEIDTPLMRLAELRGRNDAERAYRLGIEAIQEIRTLSGSECGFAMRPSLLLARAQRDVPSLRREFEGRRQAKLPVRWLDGADLKADYGITRPAAIRSSIAAECDPYLLAHRLLHLASRRGLRIFDRTECRKYRSTRGGIAASTGRGFNIRARSIFFATGYETQDFFPSRIVRLASTYAFISEPQDSLASWKDRSLIWETGDAYLYCRTCSDGRVLVGGEDDQIVAPGRRDRRISSKTRRLLRRFRTVFPGINLEPAFSWAGVFGSTEDGLAYIGAHPSFPRCYFGLGFGGNGITFGAIAARILTNLFLGRPDPDARLFRFDRGVR